MRYKLINIKIHKRVQKIGPYDRSFMWLESELFDDTNPWNNPPILPKWISCSEPFVEMFLPYTNDGKTVDIERLENDIKHGKIKDILHIDNMFRTTVQIGNYKRVTLTMQKINGQWVNDPKSVAQRLADRLIDNEGEQC